jgi:hypothetical protein
VSARSKRVFLIYRASDDSLRVNRQRPALAWDEIAFTVDVTIPDPWGRLAGSILIELPETGPAVIEVHHDEEDDN